MPRDARAADAAAIAALLRVSKATAMPWLAVVHTPAEDLAWVSGVLLPTSRVRVVEEEGEVLGVPLAPLELGLQRGVLQEQLRDPGLQGGEFREHLSDERQESLFPQLCKLRECRHETDL